MNFILMSRQLVAIFFGGLVLALVAPPAMAGCTESKIMRLAKQGKTVATIARTCDMTKDEVKDVIDDKGDAGSDADEKDAEKDKMLPSGTPLAACACYGPVTPAHREPNPNCRSGYARPRACAQPCVGGGLAWQGVCG